MRQDAKKSNSNNKPFYPKLNVIILKSKYGQTKHKLNISICNSLEKLDDTE